MAIPLREITGMPAFSSCYPMPPCRYRQARFQFVFFRADAVAVDRVLPECFAPRDGLCVAMGLAVPWSSSYGAFEESALSVPCTFEGRSGYFCAVAFLNSRSSIPAGREIYGTPKVHAGITVSMDERVMCTDTVVGGASVMSLRSTMHREARPEDVPPTGPNWRLKVIPRADGRGPEVMQVIDTDGATTDRQVHLCRAGDGVVQFNPSAVFDLSDFAPLSFHGAWYLEMDYTEGYGQVVRDFSGE